MKNNKYIQLLTILFMTGMLFTLSGCGSSMMMKSDTILEPDSNQAIVTFIRPSTYGGAVKFAIWDRDKFIGILTARSHVQYVTEPGEHLFMANSENWSYVKADLKAGKHYIIIGKVFPGHWRMRVALDPVNKDDEYQKRSGQWLNELNPTKVIPEKVDGYSSPRMRDINKAIQDYEAGAAKFSILEADDHIHL